MIKETSKREQLMAMCFAACFYGAVGSFFGYNIYKDETRPFDPSEYESDAVKETKTNLNLLKEEYAGNARLERIMNNFIGYTPRSDIGRYEMSQFMLDKKIELVLEPTMSSGAVVQVYKNRIVLNQDVAPNVQELAVAKAVEYMAQQETDRVDYGHGEAFNIGTGELVPVDKFHSEYRQIMVPAP